MQIHENQRFVCGSVRQVVVEAVERGTSLEKMRMVIKNPLRRARKQIPV